MWSLGIRSSAPLGNWQAFKTFPLIHISKIMIRWYSVFTSQSCWKSWSHLVQGRTLFFGVGGTSSTGSKGTVMEQLVSRTGGLDWNYIANSYALQKLSCNWDVIWSPRVLTNALLGQLDTLTTVFHGTHFQFGAANSSIFPLRMPHQQISLKLFEMHLPELEHIFSIVQDRCKLPASSNLSLVFLLGGANILNGYSVYYFTCEPPGKDVVEPELGRPVWKAFWHVWAKMFTLTDVPTASTWLDSPSTTSSREGKCLRATAM